MPNNLNDCSIDQLELLKRQQLEKQSFDVFAFSWLTAACSEETLKTLMEEYEADELADVAHTAATTFLKAKKPLTKTPYGMLYLPNGRCLKGPKDGLASLCMGQFIDAEEQLFLYVLTKNMKHLAKLAIILFRPTFEAEYNNDLNKEWAIYAHKGITEVELLVILDYYQGCRELLVASYKNAFPRQKSLKEKDKTPVLTGQMIFDMVLGYHAKMVQYAQGRPQDKKQVYYESAWTVLEFIDFDILKYNMELKAIEKARRNG